MAIPASIPRPRTIGAPVIFAPSEIDYWSASTTANVARINNLSFADADAGSASVTVTFALSGGVLNASAGLGVTAIGSGTNTVVLTGSITDINAYLAANDLQFAPGGSTADRILTVTINDEGNSGSGGAQTASTSITLHKIAPTFSAGNDVVDLHNTDITGQNMNLAGGNIP